MMPGDAARHDVGDFNGGTGTGTYVAETGDGVLRRPARQRVLGSTMPAGWRGSG